MGKFVISILGLALVVVAVLVAPDVKRYIKISTM